MFKFERVNGFSNLLFAYATVWEIRGPQLEESDTNEQFTFDFYRRLSSDWRACEISSLLLI